MQFPPTNPALERALLARAYSEPTPVQAAVLCPDAAERDLLVSAQTGSGKTVAFGLALFQHGARRRRAASTGRRHPLALDHRAHPRTGAAGATPN